MGTPVVLLLVGLAVCSSRVRGADAGPMSPGTAKPQGKEQEKGGSTKENDKDKSKDKGKEKPPACMHCGATCCLEAVCVCKQGKKKKPVTEYETKCEPICVARWSGPPWARRPAGCTDCPPDSCRCPGWVRNRKTLVKEIRDEEVDTVDRSVGYVCATCAGRGPVGCCDAAPAKPSGWWPAWWPAFLR